VRPFIGSPPNSRPHLAYISLRRIPLSRHPPHSPHGATSLSPPLVLHQFKNISGFYLHQQHPILTPSSCPPAARRHQQSSHSNHQARARMGENQPHRRSVSSPRLRFNDNSRSDILLPPLLRSTNPPSFPPPPFLSIQVNKLRCEFESVYPALCSASGSVISAIQIWRESYERPLPFVWRGEDYMNRMLGQVQAECSSMPKQRCIDF
jgi:hypothetical protein